MTMIQMFRQTLYNNYDRRYHQSNPDLIPKARMQRRHYCFHHRFLFICIILLSIILSEQLVHCQLSGGTISTSEFIDEESLSQCVDTLYIADTNGDNELNQSEFFRFLKMYQLISGLSVIALDDIQSFFDLPLEFVTIYLWAACFCDVTGNVSPNGTVEAGDDACCLNGNDHVELNPSKSNVLETYVTFLCMQVDYALSRQSQLTPTLQPTSVPTTMSPSVLPSMMPSDMPSLFPSDIPSVAPSYVPSILPSDFPSEVPSDFPSDVLSHVPSNVPSMVPSTFPSAVSSFFPTLISPLLSLSTNKPSPAPSLELICVDFQYSLSNDAGLSASDIFTGANNTVLQGLLFATRNITIEIVNTTMNRRLLQELEEGEEKDTEQDVYYNNQGIMFDTPTNHYNNNQKMGTSFASFQPDDLSSSLFLLGNTNHNYSRDIHDNGSASINSYIHTKSDKNNNISSNNNHNHDRDHSSTRVRVHDLMFLAAEHLLTKYHHLNATVGDENTTRYAQIVRGNHNNTNTYKNNYNNQNHSNNSSSKNISSNNKTSNHKNNRANAMQNLLRRNNHPNCCNSGGSGSGSGSVTHSSTTTTATTRRQRQRKRRKLAFYTDDVPVQVTAMTDNPFCSDLNRLCSLVQTRSCVVLEPGDSEDSIRAIFIQGLRNAINSGLLYQRIPLEHQP